MKVLLVEDNDDQSQFISQSLLEAGHQTDNAQDGQAGLLYAIQNQYDVIITDRMMPKMDGLQMLKALRASGNHTPVLILSALDSVEERVEGLRSGGDDYLIKPFAFSELLARIEILSRRVTSSHNDDHLLQIDTLTLDLFSRKASRAKQSIQLNTREFQILEYFMTNTGRVITRTMLLERVWNHHFDPQTNVIDVHISRLRKKIDLDSEHPLLHTVRGAGYILERRK